MYLLNMNSAFLSRHKELHSLIQGNHNGIAG